MRSIADMLEERGMRKGREEGLERGLERGLEQGLEQGQINLLVRQLNRRFGLGKEEEEAIRSCRDMERIESAADAFADPQATKRSILDVLNGNPGTP